MPKKSTKFAWLKPLVKPLSWLSRLRGLSQKTVALAGWLIYLAKNPHLFIKWLKLSAKNLKKQTLYLIKNPKVIWIFLKSLPRRARRTFIYIRNVYRRDGLKGVARNRRISGTIVTVFIFSILATALINFIHTPKAAAAWYSSNWNYRKQITIDHTKVSNTDQTNFPWLVSLTDSYLRTIANGGHVGKTDGSDIIFTSSNGTTLLNYEIEKYSASTGELEAWVKIPTLSASTDTYIYMYYGNASAPANTAANVQGTWDTNYKSVWHLADNAANTTVAESTSGGNTGTNVANTSTKTTTGKVDGALTYNGSTDSSTAGDITDLHGATKATISAWVNPTALANLKGVLATSNSTATSRFGMLTGGGIGSGNCVGSANTGVVPILGNGANNTFACTANSIIANGVWHYWTLVYDGTQGTDAGKLKFYLDATQQTLTFQASIPATLASNTDPWTIGKDSNDVATTFINAVIDEARISSTNRSADWISTEYNNQNSPSTAERLATEESKPPTSWYNSGWIYRKQITIDHTKVQNTDQTNFPVLISVSSDPNLKTTGNGGHMGNAGATDAVFTSYDSSTKLDHEIENYVASTGELEAWVRIPTLSHTQDTIIYMYYGNAGVADQQNKTGVWDDGASNFFKGVWHLGESSGNVLDSTINAATGTPTSLTQGISGNIGAAATFNGTSSQVSFGNLANANFGTNDFTVSYWIKTSSARVEAVLNKRPLCSDSSFYSTHFQANGTFSFELDQDASHTNYVAVTSTGTINNNSWRFLSFTRSGTSAKLYIDGTLDPTGSGTSAATTNLSNTANLLLGNSICVPGSKSFFSGSLDEVRLANGTARSADWIKTEFNNQSSPTTFARLASEENQTPGWYNGSWLYRKRIVLNHNQVSGSATLTNFPALISWSGDDNLAANALSSGNDILFTDSNGTALLNYEIEKYTSTTGELKAWVKIPNLLASTNNVNDTILYMYYGNPNASAETTANAQGTWDSNYQGVWHLADNAANTTVFDSTPTGNGTNAANTSTKTTTGQNDGALTYNGSTDNTTRATAAATGPPLTISAWVNKTTIGTTGVVAGVFDHTQSNWFGHYLTIDAAGTASASSATNNVFAGATTSATITGGTWHYVVGVFTSATDRKIYLDGGNVIQNTTSNSPTGIASTVIGSSYKSTPDNFFNGTIDDVRFSNSARSADWIKTEFNNQNSPATFMSVVGQEQLQSSSTLTQYDYRFFQNNNSNNVGTPLTAQNTIVSVNPSTAGNTNTTFRLRTLVHVAGQDLAQSWESYNLQYVNPGAGTCASPSGSWANVTTSSSGILFNHNSGATDGGALTSNANDPVHIANNEATNKQTYVESGTFTSSQSAVTSGNDAMWDFSLKTDNTVAQGTYYCFRVARAATGLAIDSFSYYPEILINSSPAAPTLISPASGSTLISKQPQFVLRSSDADNDYLQYKIRIFQGGSVSGGACTGGSEISGSPFDQSLSQTGWQDQNANGSTAYTANSNINQSSIAIYQYSSNLTVNQLYCWQAQALDPAGVNSFGSSSAATFTTSSSEAHIQGGANIRGGATIR